MLYDGVVCMFFDQSDGVSIGKCQGSCRLVLLPCAFEGILL